MIDFEPIFALDLREIFTIVVFVIMAVSTIISQVVNKQKQGERPQRPQRRPAPGQPVAENQPRKAKIEALGDEIGEFLRRAADKGGQRQAQPRPDQARPAQARPAQTRPAQGGMPPRPVQPRPARVRPARPLAQMPVQAEIIEPARPPVGQGLSQRVARDISTADIARHAGNLGADTRQAAAKRNKRTHETFDRQLGSLRKKLEAAEKETRTDADDSLPITSAAGLGALLSDAESLKQAIILNEILQPPGHRW